MNNQINLSLLEVDSRYKKSFYIQEIFFPLIKKKISPVNIGKVYMFAQWEEGMSDDILEETFDVIWVHDLYPREIQRLPLVLDFLSEARLLLFSSRRNLENAQKLLLERNLKVPYCYFLPYPVRVKTSKERLHNKLKIVSCASALVEDRPDVFLKAVGDFTEEISCKWLIKEEDREKAESLLVEFSCNNVELIMGKSYQSWQRLINDADIAVFLKFTAYADPDIYFNLSLAEGLACVVSDFADFADYSNYTVKKILPGINEVLELKKALKELIDNKDKRMEFANNARLFAEENCSLDFVLAEFLDVIAGCKFTLSTSSISQYPAFNSQS